MCMSRAAAAIKGWDASDNVLEQDVAEPGSLIGADKENPKGTYVGATEQGSCATTKLSSALLASWRIPIG